MALILLRWIQCSFVRESPHTFFISSAVFLQASPQGLQHAYPLLHMLIKMFKRKRSFWNTTCLHYYYIFIYCYYFFLVFSPGPDNPPHPWLISRKGTGQQCAQGWALKMHVLPLNTHCGSQGSRLPPSCGGREPQADKNSTQGNDMHDYRLHAHAADQCWRWGHFLSGEEIQRGDGGHAGVRLCMSVQKQGVCSGREVFCQLIVFSRPCACQ